MKRKNILSSLFLNMFLMAGCYGVAQTPSTPVPLAPPNEAGELVKQGQKLNSEGKQDEALARYREALVLSPDLFQAHLAAGVTLDLQGKLEEARSQLSRAIELASGDQKQQAWRTMAVSYAFESNSAKAAEFEQQVFDARMAKQDFSGAAEIANEMGRIALESEDFKGGYNWYKLGYDTALRKTDLKDADKALWLFRWEHAQARLAVRQDDRAEAQKHIAAAKAALDKANNPDQSRFFPYLTGYVAFYSGDLQAAITDLQKADQHDPFILSLLGQAFERNGDTPKATEYYRLVMASNSHSPANAVARPLARKRLAGQ